MAKEYEDADPEYAWERNKLIPQAVSAADAAMGDEECPPGFFPGERERWMARWNLTFHQTMNKLWSSRKK
jgi:hypothetical protein